nr:MAG TPA: major capsid protein [Caudoviricetes sp.]
MAATKVESLTNPRDSLPNTYTSVTAREVDFVTRFNDNWDALRNIMGIMRPIRKAPGTSLISYTADVALEDGDVGAGEVIPYSKATITQATKDDLSIKKYAKAVPIEDVDKYGAEIAVEKSDDAFLTKLQNVVLGNFYTFLNTGSLTGTAATWQAALAKAQGEVLNKFAGMAKDVTSVVGFANILDAYDYLGAADISVQTQFGLNYVKDFMGYSTLFLLPTTVSGNNAIARNTVIATPVENIDLYYADPGDSEFARLGLNYTVQGETNLIGFHAQGNYSTAVGESYAIMGMKLWAEYLDGIAKITVTPAP